MKRPRLKDPLVNCGSNAPVKPAAAKPDSGPCCKACGVPMSEHPGLQTLCEMFEDIQKDRDTMIEAIKAHQRLLRSVGLGESPDDKALHESIPAWAR